MKSSKPNLLYEFGCIFSRAVSVQHFSSFLESMKNRHNQPVNLSQHTALPFGFRKVTTLKRVTD